MKKFRAQRLAVFRLTMHSPVLQTVDVYISVNCTDSHLSLHSQMKNGVTMNQTQFFFYTDKNIKKILVHYS